MNWHDDVDFKPHEAKNSDGDVSSICGDKLCLLFLYSEEKKKRSGLCEHLPEVTMRNYFLLQAIRKSRVTL